MCEPLEQIACGGGHVIARTTSDGMLSWGYAGTWAQLQSHLTAVGGEEEATGGGGGFAARVTSARAAMGVAPVLLPRSIDLTSDAGGAMAGSGGTLPVVCRHVAAGRHCAVFVGEPVQPIPDSEAALVIQCTFRRDRARKQVQNKKKEEKAAAVIGDRACDYLARKALVSAQQQKQAAEREAAATRMQAHARRRMQSRTVDEKRTEQQAVVWATAKSAEAEDKKPKPRNPSPPKTNKRVGGGFSRKQSIASGKR